MPELFQRPGWMTPIGSAMAPASPQQVCAKLGATGAYTPDLAKFGGTLAMLSLTERVAPYSDMDVGRVRWACETLDVTDRFSEVLGDIAVLGEIEATESWTPGALRRVERDAEIDVVRVYILTPTVDGEHRPPIEGLGT